GLTVDFDQHADAAAGVNVGLDQSFRRDAPGFFRRLRQPFFAQNFNRPFHVTAGFGQRFFTVHHAGAGFLPQFFYHGCRNLHPSIPPSTSSHRESPETFSKKVARMASPILCHPSSSSLL